MLFTSYGFIAFTAVLLAVYYLAPKKAQTAVLLLAGYFFYFKASPSYLIYILATSLSTWLCTVRVQKDADTQKLYLAENKESLSKEEKKEYKDAHKKKRKTLTTLCILFNLGILAVVKYTNSAISIINGVGSLFGEGPALSFVNLALPMGISFYTFQAVGYLCDVNRGTVRAERNPAKLALFVSFFPQLVQGPISRFSALSESLFAEHKFEWMTVRHGLERVLWGYFKKLVIADRLLPAVLEITKDPATYGGAYALFGMILYTFELYADFTGGIDITIGIAQMLGITVAENFDRPYFSKSLKEYWRRWHISMSTWFKDYVFYPCSSSSWMQKFAKFCKAHLPQGMARKLPVYTVSFITWFCTGIWHGSTLNFLVWGLLNWLVLTVSQELEPVYAKINAKLPQTRLYDAFRVLRTLALVCVLNLFDCYASVGDTCRAIISIFTVANYGQFFAAGALQGLGLQARDYVIAALALALVLAVSLRQRRGSVRAQLDTLPQALRYTLYFALFVCIILFGAYGIGYDSSQFIYNRF